MTLWIVLTLMTALASAALMIPLVRRHETRSEDDPVVSVLKTQLSEIETQAQEGSLRPDEAAALATEVKRRLLVEAREDTAPLRPLGQKALIRLGLGLVAVVALAATGLYAVLGRPDVPSSVATSAQDAPHPGGDVTAMIAGLEAKLKQSPNDAQGWSMLGWSYFQTARYAEAAKAYGRAGALEPANAEHFSAEGEALVRAASQQVTPDASAAFTKALAVDPGDPRARYFLAVGKDQAGNHKGAMDDWIAILKTAPPGAPWAGQIRAFVEQTARERGEDISARLPPLTASPTAPDQAQVAAAGQMTDAQRQAMINGMVEALAARLKANPKDADGWLRLMKARMVMGQPNEAAAALHDARTAFASSPTDIARLSDAAKAMGVPQS